MAMKIKTVGIVAVVLVLIGFVLSIVGMCTPILSNGKLEFSVGLFDESWSKLDQMSDLTELLGKSVPSRTLTLITFIVLLVGGAAALANAVLSMFDKNIKILGVLAGVVMIVGGIAVLAADIWLAVDYSDFLGATGDNSILMGIGAWLALLGGLFGGISSIVTAKKAAKKAKKK